jgi:hypothetical protein
VAWVVHVGRAAIGGAGAAAAVFGFVSIVFMLTENSHLGVRALDLLGVFGAVVGAIYGIIVESRFTSPVRTLDENATK